ncbi:MAG: MFS transporter [Bacteroidales bacterium]|nr:MFS transporter [Bacteroidales bacterium]
MNTKLKLILMNFLEFAVWGAYLTCMGNYLGRVGMGGEISWFYAIQGLVSIFMPTLIGIIGDKFIQPQRLLGLCHLLAGVFMIGLFYIGATQAIPNKALFITIYTLSVAFYMPTLALSNTTAFTILKNDGQDTVKAFPSIRVFGTIGFIATMWFVNCATFDGETFGMTLGASDFKFQYTHYQFLISGILSVLLCLYCFTLPQCKLEPKASKSLAEAFGLDAFKLFKSRQMATFFIFSALLGMSLQVTNSFATPFLTSFKEAFPNSFCANNATMLVSLSQIAEALCILLIPFFLKRFGIKIVMMIAMGAWVLRFGFFGLGSPDFPGVLFFIFSCIVYGVAFDFFNVSGGLFVDQQCDPSIKASAQGLFMMMTNGIGATIGTLSAGAVINHFCQWNEQGYLIGKWSTCWYIFAAFAFVVFVLFSLLFKDNNTKANQA